LLKNPGALEKESSRLKITDKLELEEQGRILTSSTYGGKGLHGPVKILICYLDFARDNVCKKKRERQRQCWQTVKSIQATMPGNVNCLMIKGHSGSLG